MHNNFERSKVCNTIALHHFESDDVDARGFFYFIEQWIHAHNLTPSAMSGKGSKYITFSRGKKALEKENFSRLQDDSFSMNALPPEDKIGTYSFDFIIATHFRGYESYPENGVVLCWDNKLNHWERNYLIKLVQDLYAYCKPQYGYAFQRLFDLGPIYYPWGVQGESNRVRASDDEANQIANWGNIGLNESHDLYKPHMIRDVYEFNFLSSVHLNGHVGYPTLKEWILNDEARGHLEQILPDLWIWTVHSCAIDYVRQMLKKRDYLISYLDN